MAKLPSWVSVDDKGVFVVDVDKAYPKILGDLGITPAQYDQYWLEVVYQCAKMAVQDAVTGTDQDPRPAGTLVIHMSHGGTPESKEKWAMSSFTEGRGVLAATKGREAREYYQRIRAKLMQDYDNPQDVQDVLDGISQ